MRFIPTLRTAAVLFLFTVACAPAGGTRSTEAPSTGASGAPPGRSSTLVTAIRAEPASLASRQPSSGVTLTTTKRLFNANLVIFDQRGQALPYLAAEMPKLNTDSWRVSADGRMETSYKLKPNLVWHDGAPLTADDFVFASTVYAVTELGTANLAPIPLIDEVIATDPLTVVIRWKRSHAQAGALTDGLPPLPRHLLEASFQSSPPLTFAAHPYWTHEFVGAGPYRVERWEPGAFIEATSFDRHVLGTPKIQRVRIIFIGDPNSVLANMLAGEVQFSADDSIRFQQGLTLQREWGPRKGGSVLVKPDLWRSTYAQFRPEYLATPGLADLRVRKALAFTKDRDGLNQALFEGQGLMADVPFIPDSVDYYSAIEAAAVKYPYDPNQAQALLTQAGYTRGPDGVWANPTAGRLAFGLTTTSSSQNETELSILGAGWRQAGFDVSESIYPVAQAQDGQARSIFPGLFTISIPLGEDSLAAFNSAAIPRPETRWTGNNRSGWSTTEFDRLSDTFSATLDQSQRVQLISQMIRIFSDELPSIPLYFNPIPLAHVAALKGPQNAAPASQIAWDVYLWELQ